LFFSHSDGLEGLHCCAHRVLDWIMSLARRGLLSVQRWFCDARLHRVPAGGGSGAVFLCPVRIGLCMVSEFRYHILSSQRQFGYSAIGVVVYPMTSFVEESSLEDCYGNWPTNSFKPDHLPVVLGEFLLAVARLFVAASSQYSWGLGSAACYWQHEKSCFCLQATRDVLPRTLQALSLAPRM
jgi:hypothetical protein